MIGGQNNVFLLQDPTVMEQVFGHGGDSRKKMCATNSEAVEGEARQKVSVVTTTLTSALLMSSPSNSSASSVPSSSSTFTSLDEDRRQCERRLENERRFVSTDSLAARLVFPLPYSVLALVTYMHM